MLKSFFNHLFFIVCIGFFTIHIICLATVAAVAFDKQDINLQLTCPVLPTRGQTLDDFIPPHWSLLASDTLDFNNDGFTDIVAVIERRYPHNDNDPYGHDNPWHPRILFALENTCQGYALNFQDENTIRTSDEGGVFGDPWEGLSASGNAFTTSAYGGSAWRWSEEYTYKYIDGIWVLTQAHELSWAHGIQIGDYFYDYEAGAGQVTVGDFDSVDLANHDWDGDEMPEPYEITYNLKLDAPPAMLNFNLHRAKGFRDGNFPTEIKGVKLAPGVQLDPGRIPPPPAEIWDSAIVYQSPQQVGYLFRQDNTTYLAFYALGMGHVDVLLQTGSTGKDLSNIVVYKGHIYFTRKFALDAASAGNQNGKLRAEIRRVDMNGQNPQTLFTREIPDRNAYLSTSFEIFGDEIIVNVYSSVEPQAFYRVRTDGGKTELIGKFTGPPPDDAEGKTGAF